MATRRPDATWLTADGVTLEILALPAHQPDLLAWWWPLHRAARWAWYVQVAWPLHLEEFQLVGMVPRSGRADLWVYVHRGSGRELFVDQDGATYRLRPLRSRPSAGRFFACHVRTAVHQLGLQHQPPVEPGPFDVRQGVQAWLTPHPERLKVGPPRGVGATPAVPRASQATPPDGSVAELPLLGPYGESACLDPACSWCRDRAHERNGWCEDPACARCNGGEDLGTPDLDRPWPAAEATRADRPAPNWEVEGVPDQLQAQRDRRRLRGGPPSETGS